MTTQDTLGQVFRVSSPGSANGQLPQPAEHNLEIELKLSGTAIALENLWNLAVAPGAKTVSRRLISIYYDTSDLRLRRRGLTLRVRQDGNGFVQTVKVGTGAPRGVARRSEWSAPINGPTPDLMRLEDPKVREKIGLVVTGELRPIFTNEVIRHTRTYRTGGKNGEQAEIEAALDIGEIRCDGAREPISEIELELLKGSSLALLKEATRLHHESPCQFQPLSKSERGFALALGERPRVVKAAPPKLTPETSVEGGLERILANCMNHWLANHAAVLDGSDTEGVHQMRVALRQMRSALTIFKSVLPAESLEWLKREASSLTAGLGAARDWDVFVDELLQPVIRARPDDPNLKILREAMTEERRFAQERARATLRSPAYLRFILELSIWLESRGWRRNETAPSLDRRVIDLAGERLHNRHKQAMKLGLNFDSLSDESLHRLRLSLKKLRYTTEFFACLYGKGRTKPYLEALRQLQGDLGLLNDVAVAETRLRDLCGGYAGGNTGALRMAFGTVVGWHTHALFQIRPRIAKDWGAFTNAEPFWKQKR